MQRRRFDIAAAAAAGVTPGDAHGRSPDGAEIAALCDVDERRLERRRETHGRTGPAVCTDYRNDLALDAQGTRYRSRLGRNKRAGPSRAQSAGAVDDWMCRLRRFAGAPARDAAKLNAEIEEGAVCTTLVHLANISYRLGRTIDLDPQTLRCADDEAQLMFTKQWRAPFHLPALA